MTFQRQFFYSRMTSAANLRPEMQGCYPVLIWNTVPSVEDEEIASVMLKLFESGCRYVVTGGYDCERWHDIADQQFVIQFPTEEEQYPNFVMTSCHTGESPEEVTFFLVNLTNFDAHDFSEFLILQVGDDFEVESDLKAGIRKWTRTVKELTQ